MLMSQSDCEAAESSHRETVHDLRNLFTVIVAAGRLLGKDRASERGEDLLAAIEDAAFRGSQLTTNLLARDTHEAVQIVDVGARLANPWVEVRAPASRQPLPARLAPATFDSAIIELVRNAQAAISGKGPITVRARALGDHIWLTVADTDCGMIPLALQGALHAFETASARGAGLGRVQHRAKQAGGRVRIKSRAGQGSVISIVLPISLTVAVAQSATRQRHGCQADLH